MSATDESTCQTPAAARARRDLWPWLSLLPVGLGSWAPLIAGARCKVLWWRLAGLGGIATTVAGFALAGSATSPSGTNRTQGAIAGLLLLGAWFGGIGVSFGIRPGYEIRCGVPYVAPRWPVPSVRARSWPAAYAVLAFVGTFVTALAVGLVLDDALGLHVIVGLRVLIFDAILLAALIPLARMRGVSLADLGLKRTLALRSLWLDAQALAAYFILSALWVAAVIGLSSTRHTASLLSGAKHLNTLDTVITVLAVSLSAPIAEEIFFRGLLYRSLRNRLPVPHAALLAGAMFGFVHISGYPVNTLPIKALFGVIACLLYERTGSLLPGIALHSFVDATSVDISLTGNAVIVLSITAAVVAIVLLRAVQKRITGRRTVVLDDAAAAVDHGGYDRRAGSSTAPWS